MLRYEVSREAGKRRRNTRTGQTRSRVSEYTVTNEILFPLTGTNNRFWHLASINYNSAKPREFMYFEDRLTGQRYVEEITNGE